MVMNPPIFVIKHEFSELFHEFTHEFSDIIMNPPIFTIKLEFSDIGMNPPTSTIDRNPTMDMDPHSSAAEQKLG